MKSPLKLLGLIFLGVLFSLNLTAWDAVWGLNKPQVLEVIFFDVGQGDAIFIQTPQGHQILIDGGPDSSILEKLGREMPFWDRSIDLIILTHPHYDHLAGFIPVLKNYKVENILWTGILIDSTIFKEWERAIRAKGAKIYIAQDGQKITAGKATLVISHPFNNLENEKIRDQDIDETSLVLKVRFGENSFLFTGDAPKSIEKGLVERKIDLESAVLKVGHHGSKNSTADDFIQKVSPQIAVISAGKNNKYGHPHQETLDTLDKYGIRIFRTDFKEDIKIFSDGDKIIIK